MHGVLRVRTTEEEKLRKKKERAAELVIFKSQMEHAFLQRSQNIHDEDMLKLCDEILARNPDVSSVWNYRREILLTMLKDLEDEEKLVKMFDNELQLTECCLKINPKSYCAWYHRIWVMENQKNPNWKRELAVCNAYLKLDERNFHCWDYRNFIIYKTEVDMKSEFDFSTKKIEENFSNYSAWHYRSKLLPKLFPCDYDVNKIQESKYIDELELVINAAFTDPNDTSAFFYQMWLLVTTQRRNGLAVCHVAPSRSFVAFNQSVTLLSDWKVDVTVDGNQVVGTWRPLRGFKYDVLWICDHGNDLNLTGNERIEVLLKHADQIEEKVTCDRVNDDEFAGYSPATFSNDFHSSVVEKLKMHQESCEQLLELEPESKWTCLTLAVILHSINFADNYGECYKLIRKLMDVDSKRTNYYRDLFSRWHIEYFVGRHPDRVKDGKFTSPEFGDVKLSAPYHLQYWSCCKSVDLSRQEIPATHLSKLSVLLNCEVLDLRYNSLDTLRDFPNLPELNTLYLDGNDISVEDLDYLKVCTKLKTVYYTVTDLETIVSDLYNFQLEKSL